MKLNVISWNTCGAALEKISDVYGALWKSGHKNILLVQEAGVFQPVTLSTTVTNSIGGKKFDSYFVKDPYAKNERCTTGIMVEQDALGGVAQGFDEIFSGEHRPAVKTIITGDTKSFILATVHAIAREDKAKEEIVRLFDTLNGSGMEWILMGDFNCEPKTLSGTVIPENQMSFTKEPTQRSRHTLDYAIFSPFFAGKIEVNYGFPNMSGFTSDDSDHSIVNFQLSI